MMSGSRGSQVQREVERLRRFNHVQSNECSQTSGFQWTLAKGLTPESLKSGFRDGVKAAEDAARRWTDKLRQRKEQATDATRGQAGPSAEAVQPGAA
jgi:hypothetical protein